jgi:hypothetical protein
MLCSGPARRAKLGKGGDNASKEGDKENEEAEKDAEY